MHQDGRLVYWNRAGARLVGIGPSDEEQAEAFAKYYRHPITDFLHPADIPHVAERLAQLTEPGQFFEHGEIRIVAPDGTTNVMEVTSVRTTWAGEPAFQVIARDISERKAAEAANRYRASLVAHVSDARKVWNACTSGRSENATTNSPPPRTGLVVSSLLGK